MKTLRIATRSSSLAIIQTQIVVEAIKKLKHGIHFEIVEIKSQGDISQKSPLWKMPDAGLFTAAVENALRENKADIAVHSFKDLPIEQSENIVVTACLDRKFCQDCLVCNRKINSLDALPKGAKIGTSSLRRKAMLLHKRHDLTCLPIRGNVPTRIEQVEKGLFDAAVLAYAGINRLGLTDKVSLILDPMDFIPAPAQGAIAVQAKADDDEVLKLLSEIDDRTARIACEAERLVLHKLKAGCHAPAGVFAQIENDRIIIYAFVSDENGCELIKCKEQGALENAPEIAEKLADKLLKSGAAELLKNV